MTPEAGLAAVRARLDAACVAAGRAPSEVGLVAVSKLQPVAAIDAAAAAGHRDFGESYAQELRDKAADRPSLRWHFIGRLQTNKARYVANVAWRVHALETEDQARALAARAERPLSCLVAVNVGGEAQKSGVPPAEAVARCKALSRVPGIVVVGLMCLPPEREDPEDVAPFFAELAHLASVGRAEGLPLHELSMGMSHDFPVAVRHGATWVRVGTAIFGERPTTPRT